MIIEFLKSPSPLTLGLVLATTGLFCDLSHASVVSDLDAKLHTGETKKLWVESSAPLQREAIATLQNAWDQVLQRHPWGRLLPPSTGLLIESHWQGSAGYWAPNLRLSSERSSPSGAAHTPTILITERALAHDSELKRVLAHELTHLIQWEHHPSDPGWLREGLALLGEYVVTRELDHVFFSGWASPSVSLFARLEFSEDDLKKDWRQMVDSLPQYGQLLELFLYVDRNCFSDPKQSMLDAIGADYDRSKAPSDASALQWLWSVVSAAAKPNIQAIEAKVCADFDRMFEHFQKARFIQRYGSPLDYVYATSGRATTVERPSRPLALPIYSAATYFSDEKSPDRPGCRPNEQEIPVDPETGRRRCLQIRLSK